MQMDLCLWRSSPKRNLQCGTGSVKLPYGLLGVPRTPVHPVRLPPQTPTQAQRLPHSASVRTPRCMDLCCCILVTLMYLTGSKHAWQSGCGMNLQTLTDEDKQIYMSNLFLYWIMVIWKGLPVLRAAALKWKLTERSHVFFLKFFRWQNAVQLLKSNPLLKQDTHCSAMALY